MKLAPALLALTAFGCGFGTPTVVRVVDGEPIEGRFIDSVTYSLYARGAYHESRGELDLAARAYKAASERDPESAAIWTRLGSVLCVARHGGHERAFELARGADPDFAPLWRERARCALVQGDARAAARDAEKAVRLEPSDDESSLVLVRALDRAGRGEDALRWLRGLTATSPSSVTAWKLYLELAERRGKQAEARRARRVLTELTTRTHSIPRRRRLADELGQVDAALGLGDLERARRAATAAGVRSDELALRAAALGLGDLASQQAELVLSADPTNADAWVAALVAADLIGEPERFRDALGVLEDGGLAPGPFAARLMADLIARRVSPDAARAWLTAYGPLPEPSDELERRIAARLERS